MNKSGAIGTKAETAVVKAAKVRGYPDADRLRMSGADDRGDVRLTTRLEDGVVIEVKGGEMARSASENRVAGWLDEAEVERVNAGAAFAFVVVQRRGVGEARAHRWWAYVTMRSLRSLVLEIEDEYHAVSGGRGVGARLWLDRILGPLDWPVRMTLEEMLYLLSLGGFNNELIEPIEPFRERS